MSQGVRVPVKVTVNTLDCVELMVGVGVVESVAVGVGEVVPVSLSVPLLVGVGV